MSHQAIRLPVIDRIFVPNERKTEVRRRLKRARGQVDGIERMLEANRPCREILQEIAAAQEALRAAGKLMVRNYLESYVRQGIKAGRGKETYDEFLESSTRWFARRKGEAYEKRAAGDCPWRLSCPGSICGQNGD